MAFVLIYSSVRLEFSAVGDGLDGHEIGHWRAFSGDGEFLAHFEAIQELFKYLGCFYLVNFDHLDFSLSGH